MKTLYFLLLAGFVSFTTVAQPSPTGERRPILLAKFEAIQPGNGEAVQLSWTAMGESNMDGYEIQKSANGSAFSAMGNVKAQNNVTAHKYNYTDATPVNGQNYYRLRSIDKNGNTAYSNIIKVNNGFTRKHLVVVPNPVFNGVLNLQLYNFNSGPSNIMLYSNAGHKVLARSTNFSEGSSTHIINLPQGMSKGTYFLQVTDGVQQINKQIIIQ